MKTGYRVIALLVALALTRANAAEIVVTPDHVNGVYAIGETIRWAVKWDGDTPTSVDYVIKSGGLTETQKGTLQQPGGAVEAKLDSPGTLLLEVTGGEARSLGGAVVAPDRIKPSAPPPDDFDAFWQQKLSELASVAPDPKLTSQPSGKAGVDYWHITLDNIRGTRVRGQLARPAAGDHHPALLIVQWAGVYPLEKHWAIDRAGDGWLVLNISAHDVPIEEPSEFYKRQLEGPLKDYWSIGNEDRETSYYLRVYLSCYRAAEYLTSRPDWDGQTLVVLGDSQGGQQSLVTAALHPKITAAIAGIPAGCDMLGPDAGRWPGWPQWYWKTQGKNPAKVRQASRYFDVVNFTPRIKCPVMISAGLIDDVCPPAGILAAANQIKSPKEIILMPGAGHQEINGSQAAYKKRCWSDWLPTLQQGKAPPFANARND